MDGSRRGSYRRDVGSKRPSRSAIIVTVVAGCVLAAGGYAVGRSSGEGAVPASVPVRTVAQPKGADPIVVPSSVELPSR